MKKLKIKHLAAYLPYGLKFISGMDVPFDEHYENPKWTLNGVSEMFGDYCLLTKESSDAYVIDSCKPILRPLSDLTREEYWSLSGKDSSKTFGFHYGKYNGYDKREFIYREGYSSKKYFLKDGSGQFDYHMMEFFFEHHFDIFGLIEAGLAIDINTLN